MTEDELIIAKTEDKVTQAADGYYLTNTGIMDTHEQAVARSVINRAPGVRCFLYGGYDDAERRMLVCVPKDYPVSDEEAVDGLLKVLRVRKPAISRQLTHRDYLGSILGLGIERRLVGDILVRDDGADIIIVPEIADFLVKEYHQAGRTEVKTSVAELSDLIVPEGRTEIIKDTVSSLRLDSVISSAFRLSRGKAAEAIKGGIVSVDHIECLKPDARVEEGSVLVLKGKGKAVLQEVGEESRKGRLRIKIVKYI